MANYITASRILLIFPVLYLISDQNDIRNWIALTLFITAGLTDHLDGYVARKTKTESSLGGLLDLIADKLLICIPLFYLITFSGNKELLIPPIWDCFGPTEGSFFTHGQIKNPAFFLINNIFS